MASECMLAHATEEDGTPQTSGVMDLYMHLLGCLSTSHIDFVRTWMNLLSLEAASIPKMDCLIWTTSSAERSLHSASEMRKCCGNLMMISLTQDTTLPRNIRFMSSSLAGCTLGVGERVVLSCEPRRQDISRDIPAFLFVEPYLCSGTLTSMTEFEIEFQISECSGRIMKAFEDSLKKIGSLSSISYRIDKHDGYSNVKTLRCVFTKNFSVSAFYVVILHI